MKRPCKTWVSLLLRKIVSFHSQTYDKLLPCTFVIVVKHEAEIRFLQLYQHKVSPFSLADRTKPGHRKICVFFLIDPVVPIISTSQVAPQQRDWWKAELYKLNLFSKLPPELVENILNVHPHVYFLAKAVILT